MLGDLESVFSHSCISGVTRSPELLPGPPVKIVVDFRICGTPVLGDDMVFIAVVVGDFSFLITSSGREMSSLHLATGVKGGFKGGTFDT